MASWFHLDNREVSTCTNEELTIWFFEVTMTVRPDRMNKEDEENRRLGRTHCLLEIKYRYSLVATHIKLTSGLHSTVRDSRPNHIDKIFRNEGLFLSTGNAHSETNAFFVIANLNFLKNVCFVLKLCYRPYSRTWCLVNTQDLTIGYTRTRTFNIQLPVSVEKRPSRFHGWSGHRIPEASCYHWNISSLSYLRFE